MPGSPNNPDDAAAQPITGALGSIFRRVVFDDVPQNRQSQSSRDGGVGNVGLKTCDLPLGMRSAGSPSHTDGWLTSPSTSETGQHRRNRRKFLSLQRHPAGRRLTFVVIC
jgi:hypothetical protein